MKRDVDGWEEMRANLSGANLSGADLSRANLSRAYLSGADMSGANNVPYISMACPDYGEFIAWKKASGKIVKIKVLEDARRSAATGRKCRCDKAEVLAIEEMDGRNSRLNEVKSDYNNEFVYRVGHIVTVNDFCDNRF